jgi:hypothetical protein
MEGGGGGSMSFESWIATRGPSALRVELQKKWPKTTTRLKIKIFYLLQE